MLRQTRDTNVAANAYRAIKARTVEKKLDYIAPAIGELPTFIGNRLEPINHKLVRIEVALRRMERKRRGR